MSEIPEDLEKPVKTSSDKVYEHLKTYGSPKDIRGKKVKEIAESLKVSTALIYKQKNKLIGEGHWRPTKEPSEEITAVEAQIEIKPEQEIEIIEETEEIPSEFAEPSEERPSEPTPTPTPEPSPEIGAETPIIAKLLPILERSVTRMMDEGIEIFSGSKEMLTTQEGKDTAVLLPILIYRITKVALTEDQMIDTTCITHFGSIILKVVKKKVAEWRAKPKEEKKETPKPSPEPTPTPETPTEETPEKSEKKKPQDASFLKNL